MVVPGLLLSCFAPIYLYCSGLTIPFFSQGNFPYPSLWRRYAEEIFLDSQEGRYVLLSDNDSVKIWIQCRG